MCNQIILSGNNNIFFSKYKFYYNWINYPYLNIINPKLSRSLKSSLKLALNNKISFENSLFLEKLSKILSRGALN